MNCYHKDSLNTIWNMPRRLFSIVFFALMTVSVLAGCAANPRSTSVGAPALDQATDSDETEVRKRARLRLELAMGYFEQGQTRVALDEVKQSLQQDPNYADAFNLRGLIYMRLNDFRLAEDSFRQALSLAPHDGNTLHNYGWLMCQQGKYTEATAQFARALAAPNYLNAAKTALTQGTCEIRAGQFTQAEASLQRAYTLDPGNPIAAYNLSNLLFKRADYSRAQFHIRRVNNSEFANAETLWLGIKVERAMGNTDAMRQLAEQLNKRFSQSRELQWYEKGSFNE